MYIRGFCISIIILSGFLTGGCEKEEKTITDYDGNIYNTVTIGEQTWIVENLKTTHYNDGTIINLIEDGTEWKSTGSGAYCWQNNDPLDGQVYGALYNWAAVQTGKLCPSGWHVPSVNEWSALIEFSGGADTAAGKLKEAGFSHWYYPNMGATNISGYSALPGGYRNADGTFRRYFTVNGEVMGNFGYWWTSTESDSYKSHALNMFSDLYRTGELNAYKMEGMSIRCIKNN